MENIAIVYNSYHHNNTKKVIDEMAAVRKIDLIRVTEIDKYDLSAYEYIGFASGIYYQTMDKDLIKLIKEFPFSAGQKTFIVYTCGIDYRNYAKTLEDTLKKGRSDFVGTFYCRGYETFGPFKLIGGIGKGRPDEEDLKRAREFIKSI